MRNVVNFLRNASSDVIAATSSSCSLRSRPSISRMISIVGNTFSRALDSRVFSFLRALLKSDSIPKNKPRRGAAYVKTMMVKRQSLDPCRKQLLQLLLPQALDVFNFGQRLFIL